ncbi:MAG TPA: MMPL family transporter [Streptosporangiaceae bacterium]|jgi:RND superfamily putative drug exporter
MAHRRNIAAALGGWSARHRGMAIFGWLIFVVAASFIGAAAGRISLSDAQQGAGDSGRAAQILANSGLGQPAAELVLVHSTGVAVGSPAFRHAVNAAEAGIRSTGLARNMAAPLLNPRDRDALIRFDLANVPDARVSAAVAAVARAQAASPGFTMREFGDASGQQALNDTLGSNFSRAEWTALPLALIILLAAFGALLAAALPVVLAMTAYLASVGLLDLLSRLIGLSPYANSVMLLMGLAVGVDYSLFYLRRERQERAAGLSSAAALRVAAATSGRSILVSGLIVMTGMAGMLISGMNTFQGLGLAAMVVVCAAMLGSVTVLPAVLSLLGDRVLLGRIRLPGRRSRAHARRPGQGGGRIWNAVLGSVIARPKLAGTVAAGIMLCLAAPALAMHTQTLSLAQLLPWNSPAAATSRQIDAAFPGPQAPAQIVVVSRDIRSSAVRQAVASFEGLALRTGSLRAPFQVSVHPGANIAEISAALPGDGSDAASVAALTTLRHRVIPQTFGRLAGTRALAGGQLASSVDYSNQMRRAAILAFAFVLAAALIMMLISFRSLVIAGLTILLDLLSVGAAYGVMTAIFVKGWGAGLVGTHRVGAIESWIPLFMFVVLFGLSMDYHVFVLSRIREARDRGLASTAAVAEGIRGTAGVVTSAAAIMVAVFAVFGTLSMQDFKQLGVGLAAAVLLDATVIRVMLLPAAMAVLGDRSWSLPRWLRWLPQVSLAEAGSEVLEVREPARV